MKSPLTIVTPLIMGFLFTAVAHAQTEITMTRQEFVDSQLQMLKNIDAINSDVESSTDKIMKENMPPEEYQRYKRENEQLANEEQAAAAKCLGIDVAEIDEVEKKVGPKFQIGVVEVCAKYLPESFTLSGMDFSTAPALAEYSNCTLQKTADELGLSVEKFAECNGVSEQ